MKTMMVSRPPLYSRPTSVDGMHPAFANVLRATPSGDSLAGNEHSPMRPFVFPRRARGGATFGVEPQPTSLIEVAPAALSAELRAGPLHDFSALDDEELFDHTAYEYTQRVSTVDVGIQCEHRKYPSPERITTDKAMRSNECFSP